MAHLPDLLDRTIQPDLESIASAVASPLWEDLCQYLEEAYGANPQTEYSGCGMRPGWNVKFKKAGRSLCTLYPQQGGFTALVVIGQKEKTAAELALPALSPYTRQLYQNTAEGMGQRWLMLHVTDSSVLTDVKQLIALRRKPIGKGPA